MNAVLNDYSTISDSELNEHIGFYENLNFSIKTINLLVPSVIRYRFYLTIL